MRRDGAERQVCDEHLAVDRVAVLPRAAVERQIVADETRVKIRVQMPRPAFRARLPNTCSPSLHD